MMTEPKYQIGDQPTDVKHCLRCNSDDLSERLIYQINQAEITCNDCDFSWYEETTPVETYQDNLKNYSARDLITALHWTNKKDLLKALTIADNQQDQIDDLWERLTQADRGLQQFYASDFAAIIELHKLNQSQN